MLMGVGVGTCSCLVERPERPWEHLDFCYTWLLCGVECEDELVAAADLRSFFTASLTYMYGLC